MSIGFLVALLAGASACSILFEQMEQGSATDGGVEGRVDGGEVALDARNPCYEPDVLQVFHLDKNFEDACSDREIVPSRACDDDCFTLLGDGWGLQVASDEYGARSFNLVHHDALARDSLEISLDAKVAYTELRMGIFSKDDNEQGAHFGLYLVPEHAAPASSKKHFVVKTQGNGTMDTTYICSEALDVDSMHRVTVKVGLSGASIEIDGIASQYIGQAWIGDVGGGVCVDFAEAQTPSLQSNTISLVFGATNEDGLPNFTRPYLGGIFDEIVIRGWDE